MKMLFSVFIIDFSLPIILIRQKQDLPSRTATEKSTLARNKYLASSKCDIPTPWKDTFQVPRLVRVWNVAILSCGNRRLDARACGDDHRGSSPSGNLNTAESIGPRILPARRYLSYSSFFFIAIFSVRYVCTCVYYTASSGCARTRVVHCVSVAMVETHTMCPRETYN